jgi:hypothetical protein
VDEDSGAVLRRLVDLRQEYLQSLQGLGAVKQGCPLPVDTAQDKGTQGGAAAADDVGGYMGLLLGRSILSFYDTLTLLFNNMYKVQTTVHEYINHQKQVPCLQMKIQSHTCNDSNRRRNGWLSVLRRCLPRRWPGFDSRSRPDLQYVSSGKGGSFLSPCVRGGGSFSSIGIEIIKLVKFFAVAQAKVSHILRPGKALEKTPKGVIPPSLCEISQNAS